MHSLVISNDPPFDVLVVGPCMGARRSTMDELAAATVAANKVPVLS